MVTSELRLSLGRDGRIECRRGSAANAPVLSLDPAFFGPAEDDGAQRALGRFVFSLLQGLDEPPASGTNALPASEPDSPDALYEQFMSLQSRAMSEYSSSLLAIAEQSLQKSAAAGFQPAVQALKDWPTVRTVADMLIARGPVAPG